MKMKFFSIPLVVQDASSTNNSSKRRNPLLEQAFIIGAIGPPQPAPILPPYAIFTHPFIYKGFSPFSIL
jgi:hypothetical protein